MHYLVDLDNTLLDTFFINEKGNVDFYWSKDFKKDFGQSPKILLDLFKGDFLAAMGETRELEPYIEEWIDKYQLNITAKEFLEYWLSRDSNLNPQVMEWVRQKKNEGHMFYIASNQPYIRMDYVWNRFSEWHDIFSDIFTSSDFKVKKNSPKFFEICQQRIKSPYSEMCLVDDDEENITVANALGMRTIFYHTPDDLR